MLEDQHQGRRAQERLVLAVQLGFAEFGGFVRGWLVAWVAVYGWCGCGLGEGGCRGRCEGGVGVAAGEADVVRSPCEDILSA